MSYCDICDSCECDLCNVPMPTLERQTNGHEECDDEPCASCMERWEYDLEALKNLEEIDGLTAYHIANHEMMLAAGKRRLAREVRQAEIREKAFAIYADEARQAYIASYSPVLDAACFKEFQRDRREREDETYFPQMPTMCERQTNDHPINYQAPQPRCLVKNCSCESTGAIAHLVKEVDGELVPL